MKYITQRAWLTPITVCLSSRRSAVGTTVTSSLKILKSNKSSGKVR